jgi:hypothetical protein
MVMMGPLHASGRSRKVERVKGIEDFNKPFV